MAKVIAVVTSPFINVPLSFVEGRDQSIPLSFTQSMQTEPSSQQSRFQRLSLSRRQLLNRVFDLLNAHGYGIYCAGRLQQLPNLRNPRYP